MVLPTADCGAASSFFDLGEISGQGAGKDNRDLPGASSVGHPPRMPGLGHYLSDQQPWSAHYSLLFDAESRLGVRENGVQLRDFIFHGAIHWRVELRGSGAKGLHGFSSVLHCSLGSFEDTREEGMPET